jgi:hypothetical protein
MRRIQAKLVDFTCANFGKVKVDNHELAEIILEAEQPHARTEILLMPEC